MKDRRNGKMRKKRHTQPLDDLKEKTGYQKYKEEALYHTVCKVTLEEAMDLL